MLTIDDYSRYNIIAGENNRTVDYSVFTTKDYVEQIAAQLNNNIVSLSNSINNNNALIQEQLLKTVQSGINDNNSAWSEELKRMQNTMNQLQQAQNELDKNKYIPPTNTSTNEEAKKMNDTMQQFMDNTKKVMEELARKDQEIINQHSETRKTVDEHTRKMEQQNLLGNVAKDIEAPFISIGQKIDDFAIKAESAISSELFKLKDGLVKDFNIVKGEFTKDIKAISDEYKLVIKGIENEVGAVKHTISGIETKVENEFKTVKKDVVNEFNTIKSDVISFVDDSIQIGKMVLLGGVVFGGLVFYNQVRQAI